MRSTYKLGPNWVIAILPNLEEQALLSSFNPLSLNNNGLPLVPISDPTNQIARSTQLKVMLCPSDVHNRTLYVPSSNSTGYGPNWARGNYGANGSVQQLYCVNNTNFQLPSPPGLGLASPDWTTYYWCGVMGLNTALSIDQVTDGTSCTVLLGELRAGLNVIGHARHLGDGRRRRQQPLGPRRIR